MTAGGTATAVLGTGSVGFWIGIGIAAVGFLLATVGYWLPRRRSGDPIHPVGIWVATKKMVNEGDIRATGPESRIDITSDDLVNRGTVQADQESQMTIWADDLDRRAQH